MKIRERLSGNEAAATAMKQINPDVVAAYPITPSTEIPQYFSNFVTNGTVTTHFIPVESEHSAMSACIGASASGARVMTATSSQGLALMYEMLNIASGLRLPIVLCVANRALSAPLNIHNDHSDSMGVRDCGFIQLYSENNQEVYDNVIMAVKIAEKCKIPVMVCFDGFITSHSIENIELLEDKDVKKFIGEYMPDEYLLDEKRNISIGPLDMQKDYFIHRKKLSEDMALSYKIIDEVYDEFYKISGRKYERVEGYMMDDAIYSIVALNSTAGTIKCCVDNLRKKGIKAGALKPRCFRPIPSKELADMCRNLKSIAILDKADSINGRSGPLFTEVTSCLYENSLNIPAENYIYGLGGFDTTDQDIENVYNDLIKIAKDNKASKKLHYLGLEEN